MSDLHPLALQVGGAIGQDARIDDAKKRELAAALAALSGADRDRAAASVLALAVEAKNAGPASKQLIEDLCDIAAAAFRGQAEIATAFTSAGLGGDYSAATGRVQETRAPRADGTPAQPKVVPKRGLGKR